ncbi:hypothetical protein GKE82_23690 [Conexibacter sp. W3-3-2]|uniref:hypothetical protein n=1 Tax=Conexibacter sp. W3-3-2 TaxID=2675227 RepID=UPI0012B7D570|nr:hypothetical protein [Conexibacter sp. W3-3-2]MTD47209.1 hypothetical protein [Conexibacter sp. W3-3-2]
MTIAITDIATVDGPQPRPEPHRLARRERQARTARHRTQQERRAQRDARLAIHLARRGHSVAYILDALTAPITDAQFRLAQAALAADAIWATVRKECPNGRPNLHPLFAVVDELDQIGHDAAAAALEAA